MQLYYDFAGFEKNIPKIAKLQQKRPLVKPRSDIP